MQEPRTLNSGKRIGYGLGLFLEKYSGVAEVAHPGTTAGYVAWLGRLPAKDVSIALACNGAPADALDIAHQLARLFSDLPAAKKPVISDNIRGGLYVSLRDHLTTKVVRTGNSLTLDGWPNKVKVRSEGDKLIFDNPVFGATCGNARSLGRQRT